MNETTKKCLMCAEQIPLAAVTCEYCGARFEVSITGYCQNCHQVRDADENGCCKVCENAVLDWHVESRVLEEQVQDPRQIMARAEMAKPKKSLLPISLLAGILILAVIAGALGFGRREMSVIFNGLVSTRFTPANTLLPTDTVKPPVVPTRTMSPTLTRTPLPTATATPDRRVLNPANQHLYLYVKQGKNWHAARDYCASLGGHLVTIQTSTENRFVYDLSTEYNAEVGTWLGATDEEEEGTWAWVTGESWEYRDWLRRPPVQSEPDNLTGDPNNVTSEDIAKGADYLTFDGWDRVWQDWSNTEMYFVCEWEP